MHSNANVNPNIDFWFIKLSSLFCIFFGLHNQLSEGLPAKSIAGFYHAATKQNKTNVTHTKVGLFLHKGNVSFASTGEMYLSDNYILCESRGSFLLPTTDWLMNTSLGGDLATLKQMTSLRVVDIQEHALLWQRCRIGTLFTPFPSEPKLLQ